MRKIVIATGNISKIKELEDELGRLGLEYDIFNTNFIKDIEMQSLNSEEVVKEKILYLYSFYEKKEDDIIFICEDTGFGIKNEGEYNGEWFPGALIKYYWKCKNILDIVRINKNSLAKFTTCFASFIPQTMELKVFRCDIIGRISEEPKGENGFDFDKIFIPENDIRTIGEMSIIEKKEFSARIKAFQKLINFYS